MAHSVSKQAGSKYCNFGTDLKMPSPEFTNRESISLLQTASMLHDLTGLDLSQYHYVRESVYAAIGCRC